MKEEGEAVKLHLHKTKIICTIGFASESIVVMGKMIHAGMDIVRLNIMQQFSPDRVRKFRL